MSFNARDTARPPTPNAVSIGAIEILRLSKIIRRPITYTVIQTILVNMVVDGNPLPCFLDQRLKKPTTSFANACVIEPTSNT